MVVAVEEEIMLCCKVIICDNTLVRFLSSMQSTDFIHCTVLFLLFYSTVVVTYILMAKKRNILANYTYKSAKYLLENNLGTCEYYSNIRCLTLMHLLYTHNMDIFTKTFVQDENMHIFQRKQSILVREIIYNSVIYKY